MLRGADPDKYSKVEAFGTGAGPHNERVTYEILFECDVDPAGTRALTAREWHAQALAKAITQPATLRKTLKTGREGTL